MEDGKFDKSDKAIGALLLLVLVFIALNVVRYVVKHH